MLTCRCFYRCGSVASYASTGIARGEMVVCLSHSGIVSQEVQLLLRDREMIVSFENLAMLSSDPL